MKRIKIISKLPFLALLDYVKVALLDYSRSLRFRGLIFCEGAELGHKLLLNINRKAYMESPMTSSHMTLSDLEGQIQGKSDFEALYLATELGLCYYEISLQKIASRHINCRYQLPVSSRAPRSMDLLFCL